MRKALAVTAVMSGLLVAGCSGGEGTTPPAPTGGDQPTTAASEPARTGPSKNLELADKCSIVTEQQWRGLGADQPPRQRDSEGLAGCQYQLGAAGSEGWAYFVATNPGETMKQFAQQRPNGIGTQVAAYPAFQEQTGDSGCTLSVDVSDQGSLLVNGRVRSTNEQVKADPCELSKQFAEAALANLPNA